MQNRMLALLLAALVAVACICALAYERQDGLYAQSKVNGLRVRKGPSVGTGKLARLDKGDTALVTGESGNWLNVLLDDGTEGWIYGKYADKAYSGDGSADLPEDEAPEKNDMVDLDFVAHIVRADGWNDYTPITPVLISDENQLDNFKPTNTDEGYEANFKEAYELISTFDLSEKRIVAFSVCAGSGSTRFDVESIVVDGGVLSVTVSSETPEIGTDDMAEWLIFAEITDMDTRIDEIEINRAKPAPRVAVIELESNPTTGYDWTYTATNADVFTETRNEYVPNDATGETMLTGAGGTHYFAFAGSKEGTATLTFVYTRPWETGVEPAETAKFTLVTDGSGNVSISPAD